MSNSIFHTFLLMYILSSYFAKAKIYLINVSEVMSFKYSKCWNQLLNFIIKSWYKVLHSLFVYFKLLFYVFLRRFPPRAVTLSNASKHFLDRTFVLKKVTFKYLGFWHFIWKPTVIHNLYFQSCVRETCNFSIKYPVSELICNKLQLFSVLQKIMIIYINNIS